MILDTFDKDVPPIVWNTLDFTPPPPNPFWIFRVCLMMIVHLLYINWYRLPVESPLLLEQVVTSWTLWDREPSTVHIHHSAAFVCVASHPVPNIVYLTLVFFSSLASISYSIIPCSMVYFIISLAIPGLLTL